MSERIAVINTGASTLKLALFDTTHGKPQERQRIERHWSSGNDRQALIAAALDELDAAPDAFGHRVVHGGTRFIDPVLLDTELEGELARLVTLAPLHNEPALAAIKAVRKRFPAHPAIAVFDTAFHAVRPEESMRYALPDGISERFGIRRYGFHGLAHASLLESLAAARGTPVADTDGVTLQLGAGCSACAIRHGRSIETSMGYTPLEGLVMATRSGNIDPAIVLRLTRAGFDAERIERILTRHAGLEALAGASDMRDIVAAASAGDSDAEFALRLFCYRIILTVGAYLTLLDGRGALVFGGGIGTNSPEVRSLVMRGLSAWGVEPDEERNTRNEPGRVSAPESRPVFAFKTDEETQILRAVVRLTG